jgi:hypothetical protein
MISSLDRSWYVASCGLQGTLYVHRYYQVFSPHTGSCATRCLVLITRITKYYHRLSTTTF